MKILHTSDIHIDSPLTARLTSDKARERRAELRSGFSRLISEARLQGVKAFIIAGDLFDESKISRRSLLSVLDAISEAREISFYYLPGNHEGDALISSGAVLPENLNIFGDEWTYFESDEVCFAGRGRICENIFDSLALSEGKKNVVVLHGELRDGKCADGVIGTKDAAERGISYLALGHYHSYSSTRIDEKCIAVYSGTPEGRGFDETGEKGYVMIDTDEELSFEFVPFAKRRLHIAEVDITGLTRPSEIEERTDIALSSIPYSDIVRLELVGGYPPELWRDTERLLQKFSGKFYYFEVKDSSRPIINPDSYKNDKSLKGEFIRTVMADDALSEDEKARIILCGINALMGEELFGG